MLFQNGAGFFSPENFLFCRNDILSFQNWAGRFISTQLLWTWKPNFETEGGHWGKTKSLRGKNACAILEQHCRGKRIPPRCVILHESRQNIIFFIMTILFLKSVSYLTITTFISKIWHAIKSLISCASKRGRREVNCSSRRCTFMAEPHI